MYPKEKEINYMLISRHSISISLLCIKPSFEEKIKSVPVFGFFTAGRLLEVFGIERTDSKPESETIYSWEDFWNDHDAVHKLQKYDNMIVKNSEKQEQNIEEYFKQIGMCGRVGIVDIGWKGSMQSYLEELSKVLGIETDINGFYLRKEMREGVDTLKYDLMGCGWKIGYLKNVFKVPLPYGKLFVLLRKNRV